MKQKIYKRKRIIPVGWKEIKLGDVFRTSSGSTPLSTEKSYYEGGVIPWINSGELASPYIYKTSNYITQKGFENSSTELYPKDTVLVAMYGATAGKASLLKLEACTNQAICAILPNEDYCPEFIKYNIDTLYEHLVGLSSGSARDNLSQAGLKELKLVLPKTKKEQEKLVSVLSLLDRKIELNRQINDNLEAMAKQLYDYWFVQFDFPNEEGKPYKSNGGAMVWNEKLKREIPQGLDTQKIGDIEKNIITGKTPSCADEDNFGGDIPFVTIDDIRGNLFVFEAQRTLSTKGADSQEKKYLPIGSLSVSCIGTIGVMGFVARLAQTNQQINSIVFEHEYNKEFLYFSLKLYYGNAKAKTGNVFANMSKDEFASITVAYPPKQILQAFHNKVAPIFDSIKNNIEEINSLTKQRDELLPLLMNGQATVNYHLFVLFISKIIVYYKETNINFEYERNNTKRFRWNEIGFDR